MVWKLATFNVNGIRARLPIVVDWVAAQQPDVLCLQEIKCRDEDFPASPFIDAGYSVTVRGQKSFNGVAIVSKQPPQAILREFNDGESDEEARLLCIQVNGVWVVNTYVPQGRSPQDPAFQQKLQFFARLNRLFHARFDPHEPMVWTGDINVAPTPLDVFDPKRMEGQVGFHPAEWEALATVTRWGLVDLYRKHHPDARQFTFWDYRLPKSLDRDLGWRIDHILATEPLASASLDCRVDVEPRRLEKPSDHTAVVAEFELERVVRRD